MPNSSSSEKGGFTSPASRNSRQFGCGHFGGVWDSHDRCVGCRANNRQLCFKATPCLQCITWDESAWTSYKKCLQKAVRRAKSSPVRTHIQAAIDRVTPPLPGSPVPSTASSRAAGRTVTATVRSTVSKTTTRQRADLSVSPRGSRVNSPSAAVCRPRASLLIHKDAPTAAATVRPCSPPAVPRVAVSSAPIDHTLPDNHRGRRRRRREPSNFPSDRASHRGFHRDDHRDGHRGGSRDHRDGHWGGGRRDGHRDGHRDNANKLSRSRSSRRESASPASRRAQPESQHCSRRETWEEYQAYLQWYHYQEGVRSSRADQPDTQAWYQSLPRGYTAPSAVPVPPSASGAPQEVQVPQDQVAAIQDPTLLSG